MTAVSRAGVVLVFAALVFMGVSWKGQLDTNARLRAEIEQAQERFAAMAREHEQALAAVGEAMRARDEIRAMARERQKDAQKIYESCPDVAGILLPDSMRLFIAGQADLCRPAGAD